MRSGQGFSLLCPAQGFPVPSFKYVTSYRGLILSHLKIDPVASKAPAFSTTSHSVSFKMRFGEAFTLLCPAQGFPVPSFKYVFTTSLYNKLLHRSGGLKSSFFFHDFFEFHVQNAFRRWILPAMPSAGVPSPFIQVCLYYR
jgi:hypothetical protein